MLGRDAVGLEHGPANDERRIVVPGGRARQGLVHRRVPRTRLAVADDHGPGELAPRGGESVREVLGPLGQAEPELRRVEIAVVRYREREVTFPSGGGVRIKRVDVGPCLGAVPAAGGEWGHP